jgi:hypothetical protein
MAWQPDFGKMFMAGLVVLGGIWITPFMAWLGVFMVAGGLVYAIASGTGVFIGNVTPLIAAGNIATSLKAKVK